MSSSPTARRRRLGHELRRLREAAQLKAEEVAGRLHWSATKMSRIETGQVSVHHGDVADLLDIYGVSDETLRTELSDMARQSRLKGWWHRHRDTFKRGFDSYIGLEAEASNLQTYQAQVIPGLLQTEAYARAVIDATAMGHASLDDVDKKIAVRMSRQELLTRPNPLRLHVILDEAVLRRVVGGTETMAEQLGTLLARGKMPNITLQVLPFSVGAHAALDGEFSILEFPDPKDSDLVYLEENTSGLILEEPGDLKCYAEMFAQLTSQALDPDESTSFIASLTRSEVSAP
ncbi:helix-turn-helix domain-containing protein [Nonomuraea sp. K274]|uniref:Helix-turn-helix domain-containing protein n=1 Tax=Nonomuraea cypriaca TaxID=1187855 RepID=A0A931F0E7_9ACTN|nr:helix-turn-helix transcriptional regulator [Nonomuraea cypriaca]MBF8188527.1 helix-turn-helix domain-containing protein [Nonomuraea cypriaca]